MSHEYFLQIAIQLALENVQTAQGGPFGAVVVRDGEIIGVGQNRVTAQHDPTAHAEVQAIRDACQRLGSFQLDRCIIYSSCEPCPMCLGAIYWARPQAVYFACTKRDAAQIGFDDHFIYEEMALSVEERKIKMKQISLQGQLAPFQEWEKSTQKTEY